MSRRRRSYLFLALALAAWVIAATLLVFTEELPPRVLGAVLLGVAVGFGVAGGFGLRRSR
jgi:hypothetical protein